MADDEQQTAAQQQVRRSRPKNAADGAVAQAHAPANSTCLPDVGTPRDTCCKLPSGPHLSAAVDLLTSGVSSLQLTLATLMQAAQQEREDLQQEKQQLEADKAAFEQETQRVQQVFADRDQIVLDVGGYR